MCNEFEHFEDCQLEDTYSAGQSKEAMLLSPKSSLKKCRFCNFKKRSCTLHKSNCTAVSSTCYSCNKAGHFPKSLNCKKTRRSKRKSKLLHTMLNDDLSERSSEFSINDLILSNIRYKYPRWAVVEELQSSSGFYLNYVKIGYLSYSQRQKKVNYKETEETKIGRIVEECNTLQFNISKTKGWGGGGWWAP